MERKTNLHVQLIHKPGNDKRLPSEFIALRGARVLDNALDPLDDTLLGLNWWQVNDGVSH